MAMKNYFKSLDDEFCYPLVVHLKEAASDGLKQIRLYEAIPDRDCGYVWCSLFAEVVEKCDCVKPSCDRYKANKSGRGVCVHRGMCYAHGDEVLFNVPFF